MSWQLKAGSIRMSVNPDDTLALSFVLTDGRAEETVTPQMVGRVTDYSDDPEALRKTVANHVGKFIRRCDSLDALKDRAGTIDTSALDDFTHEELFPPPEPRPDPSPEDLAFQAFMVELRAWRLLAAEFAAGVGSVTRAEVDAQKAAALALYLREQRYQDALLEAGL